MKDPQLDSPLPIPLNSEESDLGVHRGSTLKTLIPDSYTWAIVLIKQ